MFWSNPIKKATKEIIKNYRIVLRMDYSLEGIKREHEARDKIAALKYELFDACLAHTTMSAFLQNNDIGKTEFMDIYDTIEGLGIGQPAIAMGMTDPHVFSYILENVEELPFEVQLLLIEKYGTSW